MNKIIGGGHAAVLKAVESVDPNIVNWPVGHGTLPLYEAVRRGQADLVALLLELGADPLHPASKTLGSYNTSLLSLAAMAEGPRVTSILSDHDTPIASTGATYTAAHRGHLDTMRLLLEHGADVNEVLLDWRSRTPMHFAASKGQVDAMKFLELSGAHSDLNDIDRKTPA
jgi:ankyrin repeat protein